MTGKRDPVRFLPWVFLFVMATGVGVISAGSAWIGDSPTESLYSVLTVFVVILLLSMIAHLWLFCRLSGRPIADVRRPTLILHGAIILPAPFLFTAGLIMAFRYHFDVRGAHFLIWGGIALILIFLEARLLGSRQFFLIFGDRSLERRLGVVVFSGVFVWILSVVVLSTLFIGH